MGRSVGEYVSIATQYAVDIVNGKIPACKWTIAACQRQLDDLERDDWQYSFDVERSERPCRLIEKLPHIKGRWDSRTIVLEPWQIFIITTVFGWVDEDGLRRYRAAYEEVARKNAKSTKSAGIGLYMTGFDGELGAEVYSTATTRDQAKIVFNVARSMTLQTQGLRDRGLRANAHNIHSTSSGSKFEALSAEGSTLDGLDVHCAIVDELHAHKTRAVYDVMETATGARSQPLMFMITTAGSNMAGICYEQRTYVTKILDKVVEDDSYFGIIYTLDDEDIEGDGWTREENWIKANPNYGVSVKPFDMKRLAKKAIEMPSAQNNFLTKRLNVWVNADTAWMNMIAWHKCADRDLDISQFLGQDCYDGLDLASKIDIASHARVFERDGHYYAFLKHYLPTETIRKAANDSYHGWWKEGWLIDTPGERIDYSVIEDTLIEDSSKYGIREVAYDPHQATQFSTRMSDRGFTMVEVRPTVLNFSDPMKELEALVLEGKLHFNGDPVLTWMISNVVCHMDKKDNIYPNKERPENKIDGVIALLMALSRCMAPDEGETIDLPDDYAVTVA